MSWADFHLLCRGEFHLDLKQASLASRVDVRGRAWIEFELVDRLLIS